jgi:DNA-binding response OmpR family regulator
MQGSGTTFSIYLPRTKEEGTKSGIAEAAPEHFHGSETILLVEDEDSVRQIVRTVLEQNGYTVLECGNGAEALGTFAQDPEGIDLLITDMVLPGMGGMETADAINRQRPGIGIIIMSEYGEREAGMLDGLSAPGMFIQKPFQPETLLRNVRMVLDGEK